MEYKQSDVEFYNYYQDVFKAQVRHTFLPNEKLVFITLQPEKLTCLLPGQIEQLTKETFAELNFLLFMRRLLRRKKGTKVQTTLITGTHILLLQKGNTKR